LALSLAAAGESQGESSTVAEIVADKWCDALEFRGRVFDASGKPSANTRVSIVYREPRTLLWEVITLVSGKEGEFRFRARIEPVQLSQLHVTGQTSDGSQSGVFRFPVRGGEPPKEIVLRMAKSRVLRVGVRDQNGSAVRCARVGIAFLYHPLPLVTVTDSAGRASFQVRSSEQIRAVLAWKNELGFDYHGFSSRDMGGRDAGNNRSDGTPADSVVELTLGGVAPLVIQVLDDDQQPVEGINLVPLYLRKANDGAVGLIGFERDLGARTNGDGQATIWWWPSWGEPPRGFFTNATEFDIRNIGVDSNSRDERLKVILDRRVPIRGTVRHADGKPAEGMKIIAAGANSAGRVSETIAITDADGKYEVKVKPNGVYLILALGNRVASAPQAGFAVWPRTPIEDRDLTLRPATRVHGKLVNHVTRKPISNQRLIATQFGPALNELSDVDLPNRLIPRAKIRPRREVSTITDAQGRFELFLGDGTFDIHPPQEDVGFKTQESAEFRISSESEHELIVTTRIRSRTTK